MVDFNKLRKERGVPSKPIDPFELFRRLPRSNRELNINDLWQSQAEVLKEWNIKRDNKDVIIKLNTGGGKTLVGLIIAQSIINQTKGSVLYLCPTTQLTRQTFNLSHDYGIKTTLSRTGGDLDDDFLTGNSIMIATYAKLFNAKTQFGCADRGSDYVPLEGIILDDAHTAFPNIRDSFTLSVKREENDSLYLELCNLFREDFDEIDRIGTFDDILANKDTMILEVPYWSWKHKLSEVRTRLSSISSNYPFIWPLLRDEFDYCHALIGSRSFSITPLYPLLDKFPSFDKCPRRIYMSATLANDSTIVRTFDADVKSVSEPIAPKSLAGVGERMILAPALMNLDHNRIIDFTKLMIKEISKRAGVLILVPSNRTLAKWDDVAKIPSRSEEVDLFIQELTTNSMGAYALSNRYDGLDLPRDSCRLLVMDGKPLGENIYDSFMRYILGNSSVTTTSTAQKIEQGLGRGTRGFGDYCVIILLGNDLVPWISKTNNLAQLTPSTQAQMQLGNEISRDVKSFEEFRDTIEKCLKRDSDWIEYHADRLAEQTNQQKQDIVSLKVAGIERRHLKLIRDGYYDDSIAVLKSALEKGKIDDDLLGWLYQLCARAAYFWGNEERANDFQKEAFSLNKRLLKPRLELPYLPFSEPGIQSIRVVEPLKEYRERRGYVSEFKRITSWLNPHATTNQFEQSLQELGCMLGFHSERPENSLGKGPDVLWIVEDNHGFIIEAKSNKKPDNPFTKEDLSQMITSNEWFTTEYPEYKATKIVVQPNNYASPAISTNDIYVLTLDRLYSIISNVGTLIYELANSSSTQEVLVKMCERRLNELNLTPSGIIDNFLVPMKAKE
ncbi:MAG: DEAD/DEAH box helicase [Methanotrichaceae archaeon]